MKILEKLPKYTRVPKIVRKLDQEEEDFKTMISRYPLPIIRALKTIFEDGTPISAAAKSKGVSTQLIWYYLKKMYFLKFNKKYKGDNNG